MRYYNSHGHTMPFSRFVEVEGKERQNFTADQLHQISEKYGITARTEVIWVNADRRYVERRYGDGDAPMCFRPSDGFIIPETKAPEDTTPSYLFVVTNPRRVRHRLFVVTKP